MSIARASFLDYPLLELRAMTVWSPEQEAIFAWIADPRQHLIAEARAGSGKTFSLIEAVRRIPPRARAIFLAFNVERKDDLLAKAPKTVDVRTIHSLGMRACQRARRVVFDRDKGLKIAQKLIPRATWKDMMLLRRAVGIAKATLSSAAPSIDAALDDYELDIPRALTRERFVDAVLACLRAAREDVDTVDYDDQIWHPLIHDYRVEPYDWVFVDEWQDLTKPQMDLVLKAVKPGGHLVAVGDPKQAIYKFAGAGSSAVDSLRKRFETDTLPLTTTYRCAKAIVREAARIVPDIRALPSAREGKVSRAAVFDARPEAGDYVLSRKTAPLVTLAIDAIRRGERAEVRGRKFGEDLEGFVESLRAENVHSLLADVSRWHRAEHDRLEKRGRDTTSVDDRKDVLFAVAHKASTVDAVKARIRQLFVDVPRGAEDVAGAATVYSTVHRAKGSERERVFLVESSFMSASEIADNPERFEQEENLLYVAITRARSELTYLEGRVS
jgi:DNA helicase-2/ATP-dependent DNA helicase PcrA